MLILITNFTSVFFTFADNLVITLLQANG